MNEYVFVYGTLLKGEGNHPVIKDARFVGKASIVGELYNLGPFPGALNVGLSPDHIIRGEVYAVNKEILERLDRLEGTRSLVDTTNNLYNRIMVLVDIENEYDDVYDRVMAWTYEYNNPARVNPSALIKSGDWRKRNDGSDT